ncbi:hypothetical protein KO506_14900 [Polaribacter vadi]|uniref:hypothetical protein n=1 Tax=Polaribacter TaxID=52959 RepID=UPI001C090E70|nr:MULTISPECIES: hypothetical protein [Polaribacter]MBU3012700.1 hypothetical protein [Polaribacter vadi]MDO6742516.1 hypothetical protein [Polaribacter sp. 1_MG-2023]
MELKECLEFCKICKNRHVDFKTGLVCSLTNNKPEFENNCINFLKDEKEAKRVLKLKLDAAGNSRSQNGSLNPKKNINYGVFLTVAGILVLLFISLLFGAILTFGGISFFIRGKQQEKVLAENNKLNEKINENVT